MFGNNKIAIYFCNKIIAMKQIIGTPAQKEYFYPRPEVRDRILSATKNGENILLSAPRRVGKTSILLDLVNNQDDNVYAVFVDTEPIANSEDFFKAVLNAILDADLLAGFSKFSKATHDTLSKWANRIAGLKILEVGVDLKEKEKVLYYQQLIDFLDEVKLEDKTILLMIDEFPITIENIHKASGVEAAKEFLSQIRAIRQNPKLNTKLRFVFTGSIGLFTVLKRFGATDRTNDLREIKVTPLREAEARDFVTKILSPYIKEEVTKDVQDYILKKIEWWMPFYFQLLVSNLGELVKYEDMPVNATTIDVAFDKAAENGNIYFEHFKSRLAKIFADDELKFVLELMLQLKNAPITNEQVTDLAVKHDVLKAVDDILEILKHDGYIVLDNGAYKFYSPIIKKWWK